MNSQISLLHNVAKKRPKIILGLMSGTSMDGLDMALCRIKGRDRQTDIELLEFSTKPYPKAVKEKLETMVSVQECSLEEVCLMNSYLGDYSAGIILETLAKWDRRAENVDCIASHGQTLYHAPKSKHQQEGFSDTTLQIGDGDHIAHGTGILTMSDFRQKHTAAGGEGAPMVSLIDHMLFANTQEDRLLLNIGGIANFTYLPVAPDANSVTADTGPGNTLLDAAARNLLDQPYDKGGKIARSGTVHKGLLEELKSHAYFNLEPPKTTGPELFNWAFVCEAQEAVGVMDIQPSDLLATLTVFSAHTIAEAIHEVHPSGMLEVLVSGGGLYNQCLMDRLKQKLGNASFLSFEDHYFDPDAKEAACFAVLANEMLSGEGFSIDPNRSKRKINFGKISFPI